jgi:hypothetical protein
VWLRAFSGDAALDRASRCGESVSNIKLAPQMRVER